MKVRIVKWSINAPEWYKDQIGTAISVKLIAQNYYQVIGLCANILLEDCEILPEENKPEPFDLERALKGDKVIDGEGNEITELFYFKTSDSNCPVVAAIKGKGTRSYTTEGVYNTYGHASIHDLFMAPKPSEYVTKWVNVYSEKQLSNHFHLGALFDSQESAVKNNADREEAKHIDTIPITLKLPS